MDLTKNDLIDFLCKCDKIDLSKMCEEIEMSKKLDIINKHKQHFSITLGKDGRYRTYLPDKNGKKGKCLRKSSLDDLEKSIVDFYSSEKELSFKDVYLQWRSVQDELVTNNSIYRYNTDYKRFFENKEFEKRQIETITEDDLKVYFCKTIIDNKLNKTSFKHLYGYVKCTFDKAYREEKINKNPMLFLQCKQFYKYCEEIEKPIEKSIIGKEDFKLLLQRLKQDHIEKPDYIPSYAVEFSSLTGMRVAEIVALKWSDIDDNNSMFHIRRSEKYDRIKKVYYIDKTKNKKNRVFPIDAEIDKFFKNLKKIEMKYGFLSEYIFSNENGRLHAPVVSSCIKNKCKQIGITERGIHAFRKTLNSTMRVNGVSDVVASSLLGHSSEVNRQYYTFDVSSIEDKKAIIENVHCG